MEQGKKALEWKIISKYNRNGLAAALLKYKEIKHGKQQKRNKNIVIFYIQMPAPYSICTEVFKKRYRWNNMKVVWTKGIQIIEAEACKDHIHLLVSIPPYLSAAQFMGYLKGKTVWWYSTDTQIKNISMKIGIFGVEDIMLTWSVETKR